MLLLASCLEELIKSKPSYCAARVSTSTHYSAKPADFNFKSLSTILHRHIAAAKSVDQLLLLVFSSI